jgi:ketosteroid isomerase-like protein
MSNDEHGVLAAERDLQAAQRASDIAALDRLLHPDLLAVGLDGSLAGKAADLEAHRTGVFTIAELEEEELHVRTMGDTAVTFVVLHIRGTIGDDEVAGRMRYTRTWTRDGGGWRVIAAHIAPAAP